MKKRNSVGVCVFAIIGALAGASDAAAQSILACCSGAGPWRLLDSDVAIDDFNAFAAFNDAAGFPLHSTGGEIVRQRRMFIGVTGRAGAEQQIVDQYIAFKYPRVRYCESFVRPRPRFCPPRGGVLFIQPAPINPGDPIPPGGAYLRSETDSNCEAPSCPNCPQAPGACWAIEFGDQTVGEIWVR